VTQPGLYIGAVMHQRLRPRRHRFDYRTMWMMIDLDRPQADARLFSVNRFNLFSFHERDHADGKAGPLRDKVARLVREAGGDAEGRILLLTAPRVLGYVFNPLSVYFCFDRADALRTIVWEVSNTFGERHSYVLPVDRDQSVIRQSCRKLMHVSPFIGMDMEYRFRVVRKDGALSIGIVDEDRDGQLLAAAINARWKPLTDAALVRAFALAPFSTLKTILAIHWQALRLYLRGVQVLPRPAGQRKPIDAHSASTAGS
jgi:uncharacterized protein